MTNKDAFTILRLACDEIYLHDLTDEDIMDYARIGAYMIKEAHRELNKRNEELKKELEELSSKTK